MNLAAGMAFRICFLRIKSSSNKSNFTLEVSNEMNRTVGKAVPTVAALTAELYELLVNTAHILTTSHNDRQA